MIHNFEKEPSLGTVILLDAQGYELIASQPYTRTTDGAKTRLLEWETSCPAKGCGVAFRCKSGLKVNSLPRRCDEHRAFNKPVKGKRGRRVRVHVVEA